jgi:hypothetical protein
MDRRIEILSGLRTTPRDVQKVEGEKNEAHVTLFPAKKRKTQKSTTTLFGGGGWGRGGRFFADFCFSQGSGGPSPAKSET